MGRTAWLVFGSRMRHATRQLALVANHEATAVACQSINLLYNCIIRVKLLLLVHATKVTNAAAEPVHNSKAERPKPILKSHVLSSEIPGRLGPKRQEAQA